MSGPGEPADENADVRLEATATGQATVNQAGRDQHFHFSTGTRRVLPGAGSDVGCPYPGLAPFTVEQAAWFFGRDRLTAILVSRLDACLAEGGPVMVVAASGAGKSSLLRAGLLPKAAAGALTPAGSRHWPQVVFTPGAHPLRQAAAALAAACPNGSEVPAGPDPGELDALLSQAAEAAGHGSRVIVVVDQFEELFRLCEDDGERSAFISWLCRAASRDGPGGPMALAVCAVRADFYLDCTRYQQLRQVLQDNQVIVGAMSPEELREAITAPAEAAGLDIEPGLTELLLADLRADAPSAGNGTPGGDDGAGRLPLLAHALRATWQERHGSTLTVAGYRAAGGIEHAVAETAERVYARLGTAAQNETRALFLRLVKIGDVPGEDVRRPVPRPALAAGTAAEAAADAYTASRLVTQSRDTVRITHEALLSAWPRLAAWLDDDRAGHLIRQRLEDDAAEWDLGRRDSSLLYRGSRLGTTAEWAGGHLLDLTGTARRFLAVSRRRARRTSVAVRAGVAVLGALALATTVISAIALQQRSAAVAQRNAAVYSQVLAEALQFDASDASLSAQLTLAAYRLRPTQDLVPRLLNAENTPLSSAFAAAASSVGSVAFSPDGHVLADGDDNGTIRLWDVTDPSHHHLLSQAKAGSDSAPAVAFSPDGRLLAGGGDGRLQLWDVTDPARLHSLGQIPGGEDGVNAVAFSPDGRTLAAGDGDGTIKLLGITDPSHPRLLRQLNPQNGAVLSLAFSPDGRTLASGSATVQMLNVTDPANPRLLGQTEFDGSVSSVAFSPAGRTLASSDASGNIRLWDTTDPANLRLLGQAPAGASFSSVAFSPDGDTLASSGDTNGAVRLWDIANPTQPSLLSQPLTGSVPVFAVAFRPDGHLLASSDGGGTIRLWSLPETISASASPAKSVAFSTGSRIMATGNEDGAIRLWDTTDPSRLRLLSRLSTGSGQATDSLALSPGGHMLAAGDEGGTVALWNITDPARPRLLSRPLAGGAQVTYAVDTVAISPDGHTLASGGEDGTIRLWNITDLARPLLLSQTQTGGDPGSLAFGPNGQILASGDGDSTVQLWDVTHLARLRMLSQPLTGKTYVSYTVSSVAFSPYGHTLAAAGFDGTVRLWDITDPARPVLLSQTLTGGTGDVSSLAFSPDGQMLATSDSDGTARIWDLDVQYAINRICATAGSLTRQQWEQYIPQERYVASCTPTSARVPG